MTPELFRQAPETGDAIVRILAVREGIIYDKDGKPVTVFKINYETDDHYIGKIIVPAGGLTERDIKDKIKVSMEEHKWVI